MREIDDGALLVPRALPRGPHALPRDVVLVSQQRRLLEAAVATFAAKGYRDTTVADVIQRAGVSRSTFYEHFADKEQCFRSAYSDGAELHLRHVRDAAAGADDEPLERLRHGLRAYLRVLEEQPAFARTLLVEALGAGAAALALRASFQQRYVALLRDIDAAFGRRDPLRIGLCEEVFYAVTAAIDELVVRRIREGRERDLMALEPVALYVVSALLELPAEGGNA